MEFSCPKCTAKFSGIDLNLAGSPARCYDCGAEFVIPICDPTELLEWARTIDWNHLEEGVRTQVAAGHDPRTIHQFVRIFEKRREAEIWRLERLRKGKVRSHRDKLWEVVRKNTEFQEKRRALQQMRPGEFESFVSDYFQKKGFNSRVSGGSRDNGIDVEIFDKSGRLWAVAQCKRYQESNRISSPQIRNFAGSFMLSEAEYGYFFTTGRFTRHARETANRYSWLKIFDGRDLASKFKDITDTDK